ncbi:hypothetical protein ABZ345_11200 [Lentzea sp. NPDC005914]|uniref:hypothetical protein n=1 Tax=Lentzea sp. NPDC005914 TaxID=3154572 RepID=UPI0033C07B5E
MGIPRKVSAALTVAVAVGACVAVASPADAEGCYVAQSRVLPDGLMRLRLWECPSPRSSAERLAWGELRAGEGSKHEFALYYIPWQQKGSVPGSTTIPNPEREVASTPTYYSLPNELQVCITKIGPYCTWPK